MSKPLTIIFVQLDIGHENVAQLDAAIECAKMWSPRSNLVVITDMPHKWSDQCETACVKEYFDKAESFAAIYKHTSQLSEWFEVVCIYRWCIMLDYCKRHGITHIFHADSDVLIFSDLEEERKKWADCEYTLSRDHNGSYQGGNAFFSVKALEAFVAYIFSRDGAGGNDMGLLGEFANKFPNIRRGDTSDIIQGATGDHHLQTGWHQYAEGPVESNGHPSKKLSWRYGQPYAEISSEYKSKLLDVQPPCSIVEKGVRMLFLHCWGVHKSRMREYVKKSKASL